MAVQSGTWRTRRHAVCEHRTMGFLEAMGLRRRQHWVEVHDVRPIPDDRHQFDPYFAAICECGWVDAPLDSEGAARTSAAEHSPTVYPDLKRPLA